jgi:hypothetical protein
MAHPITSEKRSCFIFLGVRTRSLKPRVDAGGDIGPHADFCGKQRVHFDPAQLPPLFTQLGERTSRGASELQPQVLIRQETADDSFNGPMGQGTQPFE